MSNPFKKSGGGPSKTPTPPPATPSATPFAGNFPSQPRPLDRSFSQNTLRREENLAKKEQYRHFIDGQQGAADLMSKTAGRKMTIDTKRPIHRLWVGMMGAMSVYIVAKWTWSFSKPHFFTILNLPSQGYSISMMSPAELEFLGPIAPTPELRSGSSQLLAEVTPEMKQRKAIFNELSNEEKNELVPCYDYGSQFKHCMSYDQLHRKLDQCMLPLQQYNKCLIQHRISPVRDAVVDSIGQRTPHSPQFLEIASIASAANHTVPTPTDLYFIPTEHSEYRY